MTSLRAPSVAVLVTAVVLAAGCTTPATPRSEPRLRTQDKGALDGTSSAPVAPPKPAFGFPLMTGCVRARFTEPSLQSELVTRYDSRGRVVEQTSARLSDSGMFTGHAELAWHNGRLAKSTIAIERAARGKDEKFQGVITLTFQYGAHGELTELLEVTPAFQSRYFYRWKGSFGTPPSPAMAPHPNKVETPLPSAVLPLFLSRVTSDNPMSPLLFEGRVEVELERRFWFDESPTFREYGVVDYDARGFMSRSARPSEPVKEYSIDSGRVHITRHWSPPSSTTKTSTRTLLFDGPRLITEKVRWPKASFGRGCQYVSDRSSTCYLEAGGEVVEELFDTTCTNELFNGR